MVRETHAEICHRLEDNIKQNLVGKLDKETLRLINQMGEGQENN